MPHRRRFVERGRGELLEFERAQHRHRSARSVLVSLGLGSCVAPEEPEGARRSALGEPTNGFPTAAERLGIMAINRARSDPQTVKGAASASYPARPPVLYSYTLSRSSRFHAMNLTPDRRDVDALVALPAQHQRRDRELRRRSGVRLRERRCRRCAPRARPLRRSTPAAPIRSCASASSPRGRRPAPTARSPPPATPTRWRSSTDGWTRRRAPTATAGISPIKASRRTPWATGTRREPAASRRSTSPTRAT